jgi:hypothetical protein
MQLFRLALLSSWASTWKLGAPATTVLREGELRGRPRRRIDEMAGSVESLESRMSLTGGPNQCLLKKASDELSQGHLKSGTHRHLERGDRRLQNYILHMLLTGYAGL